MIMVRFITYSLKTPFPLRMLSFSLQQYLDKKLAFKLNGNRKVSPGSLEKERETVHHHPAAWTASVEPFHARALFIIECDV